MGGLPFNFHFVYWDFMMKTDARLDGKLELLAKELVSRTVVPGFPIADAFTMQGLDETGKPGVFAAILLAPAQSLELGTLTQFRHVLAMKLKQLNTSIPAWPIVVQGSPEVIDAHNTVPGGREYFEQVKSELIARREKMLARIERHDMIYNVRPSAAVPVEKKLAPMKPARKVKAPAKGAKQAKRAASARTSR
jgi:hypothetical protein